MTRQAGRTEGIKATRYLPRFVAAGCEPDEMGVGPIYAVPRLLKRHGLKIDDIDLWELNEAFAVQVIYCRDSSGSTRKKLKCQWRIDRSRSSVRHDRARVTGHALIEGRRRQAKYAVVTMCIGAAWAPRTARNYPLTKKRAIKAVNFQPIRRHT